MNDDHNDMVELRRRTQREWAAARIVLIGGVVIAIAAVAYLWLKPAPAPVMASLPPAQTEPRTPTRAQRAANTDASLNMLFCAQELLESQNVNIVPLSAQMAERGPHKTRVKGRLACIARTASTFYVISADLHCAQVTANKCVQLYDIQTGDGLLLYRRQS